MCSQPFESLARVTSKAKGLDKMPLIVVPWPFDASQAPKVAEQIVANMEQSARHPARTPTR
ncbi:MAG: hypothetical protein AAB502_09875 [Chloroflexota bacterium]